jgi:hypothetical protein
MVLRGRGSQLARKMMITVFFTGQKLVVFDIQPPFITQEDFWYSFLFEAESNPGP